MSKKDDFVKIPGINNSISPKFRGVLRLDSYVECRNQGFPNGDDLVDLFVYAPFDDDSVEDIEMDRIKINEILSYNAIEKLKDNVYILGQISSQVTEMNPLAITKDEFLKKKEEGSVAKTVMNLGEIAVEDMVKKIAEMKSNLTIYPVRIERNGATRFKYF